MNDKQVCTVCGVEKPITEFPKNGKDKHGRTRYRNDCKECYNITRKLTKRKVITKFLNNTKHRTGEESTYTLQDWRDVMLHFRGSCAYCRTKLTKLTKDHVVPISKGGQTIRPNIVPACPRCNSSKSDEDWVEWYNKQEFYTSEQMEVIRQWVTQ